MVRPVVAFAFVLAACTAGSSGGDGDGTETEGSSGSSGPSADDGASTPATSMGMTGTGDGTTAPVDDDTGSGGGETTAATDDAPSEETGAGFIHEFHTVLAGDGRLALESNLPRGVDDCLALDVPAPCDDEDADGLVDAWEDVVLDRLRPMRRFDEAESAIDDPDAVMGDVGRVAPGPADDLRLYVMLGYSYDYGSCGFTAHNGDSERVALALDPWTDEGGPGGVIMAQAYTAAHEGTATDHGRLFAQNELGMLVLTPDPGTAEPRWVVFPSADKHATYATIEICEAISVVPCFDEDCGPDGVDDPSLYDMLPPAANAGEEAAPRLTDLAPIGFPGDDAWAEQDFCGGQGGSGCSAPVRDKLLVDPF